MPFPSKRFAVVGCGIAGPTISFLLAEQGHQVTLFEQAPVLGPVGAGVMLQPLGLLVLKQIGLLEQVIRDAEPIHELHAIQRSGRTLIRMPFTASKTNLHAYGVHRNDIFQALLQRTRDSQVEFRLATTIATTRIRNNQVELLDGQGQVRGAFDHVVIANGSKSLLREMAGFRCWTHKYNHGAIWFNATCRDTKGKLLQIVQGTAKLMGLLPLGKDRLSLFWGIPCRDAKVFMSQPIEAWKDEVLRFYPIAERILASIEGWEQASYGTYQRSIVAPIFDTHHIFLGDAAHPMSPHLGQGLNFALLDAYRFSCCLRQHESWLDACVAYRNEQTSHLRYYRFVTRLLAPFFQSDQAWRGLFRDCVLPWFHRTPWIRGQMALTMTGLKGGFLAGRMRIPS